MIVRGTEPRLNSMMIDGERIPSPDPLLRQVAARRRAVGPAAVDRGLEGADAGHGRRRDRRQRQPRDEAGAGEAPPVRRRRRRLQRDARQLRAEQLLASPAAAASAAARSGAIVSVGGSETHARQPGHRSGLQRRHTLLDLDPRYYQVDRGRVGVTGAFDFKQGATAATRCAASSTASSTTTRTASACASASATAASSASCAIARTSSTSTRSRFNGKHLTLVGRGRLPRRSAPTPIRPIR